MANVTCGIFSIYRNKSHSYTHPGNKRAHVEYAVTAWSCSPSSANVCAKAIHAGAKRGSINDVLLFFLVNKLSIFARKGSSHIPKVRPCLCPFFGCQVPHTHSVPTHRSFRLLLLRLRVVLCRESHRTDFSCSCCSYGLSSSPPPPLPLPLPTNCDIAPAPNTLDNSRVCIHSCRGVISGFVRSCASRPLQVQYKTTND